LVDAVFYEPGTLGYEKEIAKRLEWWAARIAEQQRPSQSGPTAE
jgi:hypothetical protein